MTPSAYVGNASGGASHQVQAQPSDRAKQIKERLDRMRSQRLPHEQVWRDCADYSYPVRGVGLASEVLPSANDLQARKAKMLDSTAPDSLRLLASSTLSGLTPPNSLWFAMDVGQESHDERTWLDESAQTIFENIHAANYDSEAYDGMLDIGFAGWFVLYIGEGIDSGYAFELWPLAECFVSSTKGAAGRIDTIYRRFDLDVSQAITKYGEANVSQKTRELFKQGKLTDKVCMVLCIEPRAMYVPGALLGRNKPFAYCVTEIDTQHIVEESGYDEFPCAVARWNRIPGTPYATGPMSDALPDIKSLNEVKRWEFAGAETVIAPPLVAVDDGVLNPRNIKLGPRKILVAASADNIKPLITGARVDFGQIVAKDLQASIRKILLADQLQPQDGPAMTATEVHVRVQLIRQLLGPLYGRLQSEFLQPLIERCFGIAWRAGVLGKPPETLMQRQYTVRYLSPLARAQKMEEVTGIQQFEASLIQKAQIDPTVFDIYDVQGSARHESELLGVPQKYIRDERAVAVLQKAHQQAAAAQQQQQVQLAALARAQPTTTGA